MSPDLKVEVLKQYTFMRSNKVMKINKGNGHREIGFPFLTVSGIHQGAGMYHPLISGGTCTYNVTLGMTTQT